MKGSKRDKNERNIEISFFKVVPTQRADTRFTEPILEAASMENVSTFQFLNDLILCKSFYADSARFSAFFHNHGPNF